jgi:hypothetical protein
LVLLKFSITLSSDINHCMDNLFQSPFSNRRELCNQSIVKWVWNALLQQIRSSDQCIYPSESKYLTFLLIQPDIRAAIFPPLAVRYFIRSWICIFQPFVFGRPILFLLDCWVIFSSVVRFCGRGARISDAFAPLL